MLYISMIRLKWYEKQSLDDFKDKTLSIEDFTVRLPSLPLPLKKYKNPELLKAMLAVHLENVVAEEDEILPFPEAT